LAPSPPWKEGGGGELAQKKTRSQGSQRRGEGHCRPRPGSPSREKSLLEEASLKPKQGSSVFTKGETLPQRGPSFIEDSLSIKGRILFLFNPNYLGKKGRSPLTGEKGAGVCARNRDLLIVFRGGGARRLSTPGGERKREFTGGVMGYF